MTSMRINLSAIIIFVVVAASVSVIKCDIYLHNPRGSNNRLDEAGRNRANDNRMFDSQNNQRGGYNVGMLYYYAGSVLQIEWTNQHSCKNENAHCEVILQYMCSDLMRDGSTTQTIPEVDSQCVNNSCNTDFRFGMHETNDYYQNCKKRSRNKGLFTSSQVLGGAASATRTRQNPNGQRNGYECPEERDYYPYWQPTPWIDIAVLTNDVKRCAYYRSESENVKERYYCKVSDEYAESRGMLIPINQTECESMNYTWKMSPAHNVLAPECRETQFTRDNHLGNTIGGNPPVYNWTLPSRVLLSEQRCALRIRYNISTGDYDGWSTFQLDPAKAQLNLPTIKLNDSESAAKQDYLLRNNPNVQMFADLENFKLKINVNTAQFGRVFQDRSHVFSILQRPADLAEKKIYNLNVRGKRGNIVQVYPAVEYDFVPNRLVAPKNDYLHIQWTGSNTNPNNNDGQGLAGTDRNNIVVLGRKGYSDDSEGDQQQTPQRRQKVQGHYAVNLFEPIGEGNVTFFGFEKSDLAKLALLQLNQLGGSLRELNDAGTYFDLGPKKITSSGVVRYMCTRNNNFSNRDQKGEIVVVDYQFADQNVGKEGGLIKFDDGASSIQVPENALNDLVYFKIDQKDREHLVAELNSLASEEIADKLLDDDGDGSSLGSDFYVINPLDLNTNKPMEITLKLKRSAGTFESSASVYRINKDYSLMTKLDSASPDDLTVRFSTRVGGTYVAKYEKNYSALIGGLVGAALLCVVVIAVAIFLFKNPKYVRQIRYTAFRVKRSTENQI